MIAYTYLLCLLLSLAGLTALDWRFKLALWYDFARTLKTVGALTAVFVVWDALGIGFGIFLHGNSHFTLPLRLAPEFPLEELFFLVLLSYTTLLLLRASEKLWPNTSS